MGAWRLHVAPALTSLCCAAAVLCGAMPAAHAQPRGSGAELVMGAVGLLGVPYRYGGDDPSSGLDCSGLVRFVVRGALGVQLPRQAEAISLMGDEVGRPGLQPGDLVFFNTLGRPFSHVGIYLGDDRFVHAPARQGQVRVEQMSQPYWRARFNGARRLEPLETEAMADAFAAAQDRDSADLRDPFGALKR